MSNLHCWEMFGCTAATFSATASAGAGCGRRAVSRVAAGGGVADVGAGCGSRGRVGAVGGVVGSLGSKAAREAFEAEMIEAAVADWRIEVLGGVGHSFTNVDVDVLGMPGVAYDARADHHSWAAALRHLDETVGPVLDTGGRA